MTIEQYIENISRRYALGNATEHTFRGDLQQLIESIVPEVSATNEPKRIRCGAPDYVLMKKGIPVGFIEAKDIGDPDLAGDKKAGNKEQFDRYKASLNNLIFTDYLDFRLYVEGHFVSQVKIADLQNNRVVALPENFAAFSNLIKDFSVRVSRTISSSKKLAEMMAGKARMLSDVIERSVLSDEKTDEDSTLKDQMTAFKDVLIHDISEKEFSDVYAQTIAYGMFAARLHDQNLDTFSRQEAAELIPKSNPFLRKLFGYIAGPEIDDRIKWIVDSLADIFRATDIAALLKDFGKSTQTFDPIIHFYETFLSEYDPKLRKARGVWYTPEPVVNFIVRAVDDVLKTEFGLIDGLADTSKTKIKVDVQGKKVEKEVHRVQILDPATGTGTFLAEVIKQIHSKFAGQQGIWSNYVENELIPRLNGFELLMASYAMAHLKLDLLLSETGYVPTKNQRLHIYLTNSLEEHHPDTGTLWASWLSAEANEANYIKRDTPVMCVIGNPPYAVSSSNKGKWIENLTADYKKNLNERNIQPLSDDYIKFIRLGQNFIDKNGEGILAYISNNSFVDGIIHRQMRKRLLESFDKIYILDLHGNAKKKEVCPDGSPDQNVFDIMQGVSISVFVKTGKKKKSELGKVLHFDSFGKREIKYELLSKSSLMSIDWNELVSTGSDFSFVEQNHIQLLKYKEELFGVQELFNIGSNGVQTKRDSLFVDFSSTILEQRIKVLLSGNLPTDFTNNFKIEDSSSYPLLKKIRTNEYDINFIDDILYRPLDFRKIYYDKNLVGRPFYKVLRNIQHKSDNFCLILGRQGQVAGTDEWNLVSVSNKILDTNLFYRGGNMAFPLYLYPEEGEQTEMFASESRTPNLNMEIVGQIADKIGLKFEAEKTIQKPGRSKGDDDDAEDTLTSCGFLQDSFAPIDILDYIYAVLHSPTYREKYKEFLKIDFPRVPYPKDAETFWKLVNLGGELRQIHLLESDAVTKFITQYPANGDNVVGKISYEDGRVWINATQYFAGVPETAWEFYIGGYQPAQKWLKDRKDRALGYDEILHYQKIIVALTETDRLMRQIDLIEFEN